MEPADEGSRVYDAFAAEARRRIIQSEDREQELVRRRGVVEDFLVKLEYEQRRSAMLREQMMAELGPYCPRSIYALEDEARVHAMRALDSAANASSDLEAARKREAAHRDDLYEELYRRQRIEWARREDERRSSRGTSAGL